MDWLRLSLLWMMFFSVSAHSASSRSAEPAADQVLEQIVSALASRHLDAPMGDNAMALIDAFRHRYPHDYRVLPLAYQWGALMLEQTQRQLDQKEYVASERALVRLWELVPLTPGLEEMQQAFDITVSAVVVESSVPSVSISSASLLPVSDAVIKDIVVDNYLPIDDAVHKQFRDVDEDNSPPLASLILDGGMIDARDSAIEKKLRPLCLMAVQQGASAIVHAESRVDYRWLMVRLTLCVRRVDKQFRLRHSFRQSNERPAITLHPPRSEALQASSH